MPIRINLKEIFSSDPQEINVEKVNFNFNKLLELGIGTPGPIGTTGPQGPAGPIGLTGQQGPRGATWWVDNGLPTQVSFPVGSLIDGDLYLDGIGFETWQYDLPTDTWTKVASISTAVSNYLNQSGGSPFTKDFGLNPASPDPKFITFRIRKTASPPETQRAQINAANDILFLSNFDETLIPGFPTSPDQYFTALTSIYVDHDTTTYDQSRYHIELGSKFNDNGPKLSTSKNNLKIQYYREEINGSFPNLTQTQADSKFLNIGSFSLSIAPDDSVTTGVDSNGAFQFKVPKFNTDLSLGSINTPREELSVYFSPWESMQILDSDYSHIVADGLTLGYAVSSQLNATIGIAYNYVNSSVARLDDRDLFMIDTSASLDGILLDDYTYINGNLNVLDKVSIGDVNPTSHLTVAGNASIGDGYKAIQAPTDGAIIEGKVGLGISAPTAKLHINNNSTTENSFLVEDDTNLDSTPFVIDKDGNVGIGVVSPTSKVHINSDTATNALLVEDSAYPDSTSFVIDKDGNVGVGFGAPTAKVHINNNTTNNSFLVEDDTNPDSTPFVIDADGNVGIGFGVPAAKIHINNNTTNNSFLVEDGTNPDSTPFVIDSDGNVGVRIGTPSAPLHVQSITSTGGNVPDGLSLILQRYNTLGQSMNFFQNGGGNQILSYSSPINAKSIVMHATTDASNTPVDLAQSADIALIFKIKGNEIVRITADQRVGIGTTTPDAKLHVEGGHIKMVDGNQQAAAVMTSDANGVGSWTPFSSVGVPVGVVVSYFGNTAPAGWLICDGHTIPGDAKYDALRNHMQLLGAPLNVPDLRERFIVGVGDSSTPGAPYSLAQTGGEAAVTLNFNQIPAHRHSVVHDPNDSNSADIVINSSGGHAQRILKSRGSETTDNMQAYIAAAYSGEPNGGGGVGNGNSEWQHWGDGIHTHPATSFAGHTSMNGGGQSHENRPPYYALTYIIKY